ncbi:Kelch motif protein [Anaerobacterium chartisolvens]|uniref:Kelch motif protein n=1 Tax=Anaerobacterium chartisolvens TaxID=1297424 RepID=A0A369AM16_9FIRM|nr:kelch repeat-containing protein [Anaerobacterium chartisolvens]RCX09326.1 Kelch motif protein [Anaerobacterium chartisolvens]
MRGKGILKASFIMPIVFAIILLLMQIAGASGEGEWTAKAPMSTARGYFQAEVINGKIYAIGGRNNQGYMISVEEYNPVTNRWTAKAPIPTPRQALQTEVIGGKIYAIGGVNGSGTLPLVEVYDPATELLFFGIGMVLLM